MLRFRCFFCCRCFVVDPPGSPPPPSCRHQLENSRQPCFTAHSSLWLGVHCYENRQNLFHFLLSNAQTINDHFLNTPQQSSTYLCYAPLPLDFPQWVQWLFPSGFRHSPPFLTQAVWDEPSGLRFFCMYSVSLTQTIFPASVTQRRRSSPDCVRSSTPLSTTYRYYAFTGTRNILFRCDPT